MKKIFLMSLVLAATSNAFAAGLNSVCAILDRSLPGKAVFKSELIETEFSTETKVVISKKANSLYEAKAKEGKIIFSLNNKGTGEASTCTISIVNGITADLVDMDLDMGKFVFEDKSTRLTIFK